MKGYAKPLVTKEPNKTLYDLGDKVELTCRAANIKTGYDITWYRLYSNGTQRKFELAPINYGFPFVRVKLVLNSLSSKTAGSYKCTIARPKANYNAFQIVNVTLKGKALNKSKSLYSLSFMHNADVTR